MKTYRVELTGTTPLIMHRDNLAFSESIKAWANDPANKAGSVAGDDRSPPWTWVGYLYNDGEHIRMDNDNIMTLIREGGAKVKTGNRGETYKKQASSGLLLNDQYADFEVGGKAIGLGPIEALIGTTDFNTHLKTVKSLGFDLLVKRAKVGQAKHVRVRPIFRDWTVAYTVTVLDEEISGIDVRALTLFHEQAGALIGLGDWRPGSPKSPGPFGKFVSKIKVVR